MHSRIAYFSTREFGRIEKTKDRSMGQRETAFLNSIQIHSHFSGYPDMKPSRFSFPLYLGAIKLLDLI